jgi:methylenetetrahydrofolate reductase (NADPH)
VGHTREEISAILERYAAAGVSNILALRGDPPRDKPDYDHSQDTFPQAVDLVRFVKNFSGHPDPRGFGIGVAGFPEGHPATPNRLLEMDYLKAKVDAGADYICTQLFFDNHDFYDFRERCALAGINVPIIAGIMPVTSQSSMRRMAELAGGARFSARLVKALQRAGESSEAFRQIGLHYATEQCADLLDQGVAGIHLYTLNQSTATREICQRLGIL